MNQAMSLTVAIQAQNTAQASLASLTQNLINLQAQGGLTAGSFQLLTRGMSAAQSQANTWGRIVSNLTPPTSSLTQTTTQATTAMQRMGTVGGTANSMFRDMAGALVAVGVASKALSLVSQGLDAVKSSFIDTNAQLEQARIAFTTMLGSGAQAGGYLNMLREFAIKTPFEFKDLTAAAQRMTAMGFAASQIKPVLTDVGNAVAAVGGNKTTLDGIVLAMGQIQTKGRVMAQEINQLAERGIPGWRILSEELGVSTAQVMKLGEAGKISAETFLRAFQRFSRENFGDMMEKQSRTFLFAMANIREAIDLLIADGTLPLYSQLRDLAVATQELLTSDEFKAWASGVAGAMDQATKTITDDLKAINQAGSGVMGVLDGLGRTFVALGGGIDWAARATGVFVSHFSESIQGWSKIAAAAIHNVILSFDTLGRAMNLVATGQGAKIPDMIADQTRKMQISGQAMIAGMRQIERSGTGLWGALGKAAEDARRDFAPFLNMTPGVAESLDEIALAFVEIGDAMDKGVMKIDEYRDALGEFADDEREITGKRDTSIAKVHEGIAESYADAIKSMRRNQEDWAEAEFDIRRSAGEKMVDILEDQVSEEERILRKYSADWVKAEEEKLEPSLRIATRLEDIQRDLMAGQERTKFEALKKEQERLEHELKKAKETTEQKKAVLQTETAEQFTELDKRKRRAIEDYNEGLMRDYNRAVFAVNSQNTEAANAIAKSNEKKQAIIDNLNAEQSKVIELQKQYDDLNAKMLGRGVWLQDDATGAALPGAGIGNISVNVPTAPMQRERSVGGASTVAITGPITIQTSGDGAQTLEAFVAELQRRGIRLDVGN